MNNTNIFVCFREQLYSKRSFHNLLIKDLETNINEKCNKEKKYASWDHIILTYEIDKYCLMKQRQMPKLTDKHIVPKLIPKMRVKYASQVFSKTVSNFMDIILNLSGGKIM